MAESLFIEKVAFSLPDAETQAPFACGRCVYCKAKRYFHLRELRAACYAIECEDMSSLERVTCPNCGLGRLTVSLDQPPAAGAVIVLRQKGVDMASRPTWREEWLVPRGG